MSGFSFFLLIISASFAYGEEKCYPPYGCFNDDPPFSRSPIQLPESPANIGTKFMLFTRAQKANPDILSDADPSSIKTSTFDGKKSTVVIAHGYLEQANVFYMRLFIDKLLDKEDVNVIVVHWEKGAKFPYHQAAGNSRLVGAQLSALLELLESQFGQDLMKVHMIGSGLGAQVAGYAGRNINSKNETIGRITGLDPAAPHFENEDIAVRLDPTDADFVDVIHTDSKTFITRGYGIRQPAGHIDFYPNGGYEQKGCRSRDDGAASFFTCSHYRAVHYFVESLDGRCPFSAYPCRDYKEFKKALCTSCPPDGCPTMGYNAIEQRNKATGKFYLRTAGGSPFCVHHYKVTFHTAKGLFTDLTAGAVRVKLIGDSNTSEEIELEDRYIASGSIEDFVAVTSRNIGQLKRIKVWHKGVLDYWKLHMVEVTKYGTSKKYVGCFNRWLNAQDNEVALQEYTGRYLC